MPGAACSAYCVVLGELHELRLRASGIQASRTLYVRVRGDHLPVGLPLCPPLLQLHMAAGSGRHEAVCLLLERKASPIATDVVGETPLHLAAR